MHHLMVKPIHKWLPTAPQCLAALRALRPGETAAPPERCLHQRAKWQDYGGVSYLSESIHRYDGSNVVNNLTFMRIEPFCGSIAALGLSHNQMKQGEVIGIHIYIYI